MPSTKVEPTIPNYPPQGIQAHLDLLYLWNPDVANDLTEQLNKALEEVAANLSTYLTKAEAADTYATQQDVNTLKTDVAEKVSKSGDTMTGALIYENPNGDKLVLGRAKDIREDVSPTYENNLVIGSLMGGFNTSSAFLQFSSSHILPGLGSGFTMKLGDINIGFDTIYTHKISGGTYYGTLNIPKEDGTITLNEVNFQTPVTDDNKGATMAELAGMQTALTAEQLAAVNSGITAEHVTTYDSYATEISQAQNDATKAENTAEVAQQTANLVGQNLQSVTEKIPAAASSSNLLVDTATMNTALSTKADSSSLGTMSTKNADNYSTTEEANTLYAPISLVNTVNSKQDTLTTEQLEAVNSGVTAEKVNSYITNGLIQWSDCLEVGSFSDSGFSDFTASTFIGMDIIPLSNSLNVAVGTGVMVGEGAVGIGAYAQAQDASIAIGHGAIAEYGAIQIGGGENTESYTMKVCLDPDDPSKNFELLNTEGCVPVDRLASIPTTGGNYILQATVSGSAGSGEWVVFDYDNIANKPSINSIELSGNKTLNDLGVQPAVASVTDTSSTTITLANANANTVYHYGTLDSLTITAADTSDLETIIWFTPSANLTGITIPETLQPLNEFNPVTGKLACLSILNGTIVYGSVL